MARIGKAISALFGIIFGRCNPVGYARWLGVRCGPNLRIYGSSYKMFGTEPWLISLGENVHITDEVRFVCHDGGTLLLRAKTPDLEITKPITVGNNVYIGLRSLILPGVHIGDDCIIGAGSVVTRDVPPRTVVAGVPARILKSINDYEAKACRDSLHLGHLKGEEKARELRRVFKVDEY